MKLVPKRLESTNDYFRIQKKRIPCLDSSWHYHPQYELIYISKSSGIRFLGDNVSEFGPGELVLVGPYLPHLWRNAPEYYKNNELEVNTIVIQFTKAFIGEELFNRMEFLQINTMLEESKRGIQFTPSVASRLDRVLNDFIDLHPVKQISKLLDILDELSREDYKMISITDMRQYTQDNSQRIDKVLKYISNHYSKDLTLNEIADVASMRSTSFCRFFKQVTHRSFVQYLAEVRIQNAKRLLAQEDYTINEVSDCVGFQTISNFNKQFKRITKLTPSQFKDKISDTEK